MSIDARLRDLGGCARRRAFVRNEEDMGRLRRAVASGTVVRVGRGCYALPGTSPAVVAARLVGGVLTCVTVAELSGLPLLTTPRGVHLAMSSHRAAPRPGLLPGGAVLHWDAGVPDERSPIAAPVAGTATALAHTLRCLPAREVVGLLDAAVNRGLVDIVGLKALRPRSGALAFDRVVAAVDGRSQSLPETFTRLALRARRLQVEPQVQIDGVGRVDLLVEGVMVVELDGFAYHGDRRQFREDRRRDRVLHLLGIPVMRFTFEDAVRGTDRLVHEVAMSVRRLQESGVRPLGPGTQAVIER